MQEISVLDSIERLNLSVRANNCLWNAGIHRIQELLDYPSEDLRKLRNLGEKTYLEIIGSLEKLKQKNLYIISEDGKIITSEEDIELLGLENMYCNMLDLNSPIMKVESFLEKTPPAFRDYEYVKMLLDSLVSRGRLAEYTESVYVKPSVVDYLNNIIEDAENSTKIQIDEADLLLKRFRGFTLEQLGAERGFTRERARQIEAKVLRKMHKTKHVFREDIYFDLVTQYEISPEEFYYAFDEEIALNYIETRYKKYVKKNRKPLMEALSDYHLPMIIKIKVDKVVYRGFINIGDERVFLGRASLSDYVVRKFAKNRITFDKYLELYNSLLVEIGEEDNKKLHIIENSYRNRLRNQSDVLWVQSMRFRYYPVSNYDMEAFLEELDLGKYEDIEISSKLLFCAHHKLMAEYDIRDEYELHNLLRKIDADKYYPNIKFGRNPTIGFGNYDRASQIVELLKRIAPINKQDFAKAYGKEYGANESTVMGIFLDPIEEYYHNGIYDIGFKEFSEEERIFLDQNLTDDFYFISDIKRMFMDRFPDTDIQDFNPRALRVFDFNIYSTYILCTKYSGFNDYLASQLSAKDAFKLSDFPSSLKSVKAFYSALYSYQEVYKFVEYLPGKFISLKKLQPEGLTFELVEDFVTSVSKFVEPDKYFSIESINNDGFYHRIYDFDQFEGYFYSSLLINSKKISIRSFRSGDKRIMKLGTDRVFFGDYLEEIIRSQDSLSIYLKEILELFKEKHNIQLDPIKVKSIARECGMYIDKIHDRLYLGYSIYLKENV